MTHEQRRTFFFVRSFAALFLLGIGIIIARLFYLQVHRAPYFTARSQKNFLRIAHTPSARGDILDRNGVRLATNRPVMNLVWRGTGKNKLTAEQKEHVTAVAAIVDLPVDESLMRQLQQAERQSKEYLLASDLSFEQLSKIQEQFGAYPYLHIETESMRFYPHGTLASHVIGYLGRHIEMGGGSGKMGIEALFEHELRGSPGTVARTINARGSSIAQTELERAQSGCAISTTLDIQLQQLCEDAFPEGETGAFIIMEAETGAILSLVSRPHFDPTIFLHPVSHDAWQELQINRPFLNRALSAAYPPGSIFKLVSISTALEQGIVQPDSALTCRGYVTFAKRNYYCARRTGHGKLTTRQAVAQSCNILFYHIAKRLHIDTIAAYAHRFGLGAPTNSLFAEHTGLVPSSAWKRQRFGQPWWPGETLSIAIGQSYLLATPIQIVRMISAIFTARLTRPRFLLHEPIEHELLDLQPETLAFLQRSMKSVVRRGTGKRVGTFKDMQIYAKTSTAQTSDTLKRELGREYREHGWFVAHIRYKDHPPITFAIVIEHAGSSSAATSVAKKFLIGYKKYADALHRA